MAKQLLVTLGGKTFHANLFEDKAPRTIAALEKAGRFTSVVFSAKICSNEITWNTPVGDIDFLENETFQQTPGNIVFFPAWGAICVFFGPTEPVGLCTKLAEIHADELDAFIAEGNHVWEEQGGRVTTEIVEEVQA
ncbi:DUF3830 family protein [Bifidobacterium sp. SO4]|uniref:DUF3830 family protein n=1 Tax=Bifidobacterium sp. SO4 TaxID=2809030 RepID=UPI001BDCD415|nr:DUF3830 family protein [Bifidobacterium sp. SO4]MBT1170648.1 DUF3830 family protein [Bifidobacterium sp. SO4]